MTMTTRHGLASCLFLAAVLAPALALAGGMLPGGDAKAPYTVDADKLDFFDKEQKLIYTGNVIAIQGETKVRGSVMTIYLEKKADNDSNSQVRRIEIQGPVTVVQKDKIGTGDSALYVRGEDKWYLKGNVTLNTEGNITHGDKLTYNLNDSTAYVNGGGSSSGRVRSIIPMDNKK